MSGNKSKLCNNQNSSLTQKVWRPINHILNHKGIQHTCAWKRCIALCTRVKVVTAMNLFFQPTRTTLIFRIRYYLPNRIISTMQPHLSIHSTNNILKSTDWRLLHRIGNSYLRKLCFIGQFSKYLTLSDIQSETNPIKIVCFARTENYKKICKKWKMTTSFFNKIIKRYKMVIPELLQTQAIIVAYKGHQYVEKILYILWQVYLCPKTCLILNDIISSWHSCNAI